ncbi:hypothetical protein C2845_PM02G41810 [Panicum miliaceum]|uniref:Uncharacterized protein n=1 Tax=Panicum miliaceum TaxID=4540 RepID=A0A3L6SBY9_PANMI|nr:hypothetical protein C2845_PM02G41810 [Panicum miliaceum]
MRRNTIKVVEVEGLRVTAHEGKIAALTSRYKKILGEPGASRFSFDLRELYNEKKRKNSKLLSEKVSKQLVLSASADWFHSMRPYDRRRVPTARLADDDSQVAATGWVRA